MGEPAARIGGRGPAAAAALDRFFATFYRQRPVTATFTGLHEHDERLPDWTPEGLTRAADEAAALRTRLRDAGCPADADVRAFPDDVDLALADATLEIALAEHESRHFVHANPSLWTGEAIFGVLSLVTRDFAPLGDRLLRAEARLRAIPAFLDQLPHVLGPAPRDWKGRAKGECRVAATLLRETLPAWVASLPAGQPAGRGVVDPARWTAAAAVAAAAFERTEAWLADVAVSAEGAPTRAVYAHECAGAELLGLLLRRGHGVTASIDTLLGEATEALAHEASRLEALCRPYGGWAGAQAALAADHPAADRWLARFHERWRECRDAAETFGLVTWPDAPLRYVPYPAHVREAAPQLYYLHYRSPAPFDPAGTFDYVVPGLDGLAADAVEARLRQWNESTITLNHVVHHGAIGHHVQNHHAMRGASRLGRVAAVDAASRIAMFAGGSLAEGWACYVCDLMEEIGFLTPLERLAQQHTRVRIAARAVADLSIHSGRLTVPKTSLLYQDRAFMGAAAANGEAVRNSMFPGTAVMYWLGTRGIHQLRAEVARRQGATFSMRRFHDRLLSYGAIPVALIARLMLAEETAA